MYILVMKNNHIYRGKGKVVVKKEFEIRYGKKKGDRVYGAVVGKLARQRRMKIPSL